MATTDDMLKDAGLILERRPDGLALTDGVITVQGDFSPLLARVRPGNLNRELLVKAARIKGISPKDLTAVDATAGLGEDALLLAAAGFEVTLFERNPIIAALLRDALERAGTDPALADIVGRMNLVEGESTTALATLGFQPDVVLLDPMFPAKGKDAAVKKKLQMLQKLERPCDDEDALIEAAFAAQPRKVVVKRPVKGPHLAGRKPSYTLSGKAIRFDCYALARPGRDG